jgi:hypothetical protein
VSDPSLPLEPPAIVRQAEDLGGWLAVAAAEHQAGVEAERAGLEHYRKAGAALARAKAAAGHGSWLPALKRTGIPQQRASEYMRLAAGWDKLPPGGSFTLKEALAALAGPREEDFSGGHRPAGEWPEEARHATAEQWWDILASYALAQDCRGWDAGRIAAFWGRPVAEIGRILNPRPPVRFDTETNGAGLFGSAAVQRAVRDAYRDQVEAMIGRSLFWCYLNAAYHAHSEGWPDVRAEMEALSKRESRRWHAGDGEPLYARIEWQDRTLGVALYCCAMSDKRAALGIEPARPCLLEMLGVFLKEVKCQERAGA